MKGIILAGGKGTRLSWRGTRREARGIKRKSARGRSTNYELNGG